MNVFQYYQQKEHRVDSNADLHIVYYEENGDIYEEYIVPGQEEHYIDENGIERIHSEQIEDIIEDLEDCVYIRVNEFNEMTIHAYKQAHLYFSMGLTEMEKVEEDEDSLTFVFKRWPSRMLQLRLSSGLPFHFGLYWESCDECDEE